MRRLLALLTTVGALVTTGTAWAQPPITGTEVSRFSESFTEPFFCRDEPYVQTLQTHAVTHFTYFEETQAYHFRELMHGRSVSVPLDGTGPIYTASFRNSDSENIRAVKRSQLLVETDTDFFRIVAHGSDGSRVFVTFHAHFTVNANGEMTVRFETDEFLCP
jgi:hypothetical protein